MARRKTNTMLKTPDGIFNTEKVSSVSATETGVAIVNEQDKLMCWIHHADPDVRREISAEVSERVFQAQMGETVEQIDWSKYGLVDDGNRPTVTSSRKKGESGNAGSGNKDKALASVK